MGKLIKKIYSALTRLLLLFSAVKIRIRNGLFFRIHIQCRGKENEICIDGGELSFSKLEFRGKQNQLLNHGHIDRCRFVFEGEGNVLEVAQGCHLCYSTVFLRGNHCRIQINKNADIGGMTAVCQGENNEITIGENCLFSSGIEIWASDTHTIYDESGTVCNHSKPVHIGNHVWLGKQVAILKGCTIGSDTVVGMRSMVVKDLPSHAIVAGSPAKVIKAGISWDKKFVDVVKSMVV